MFYKRKINYPAFGIKSKDIGSAHIPKSEFPNLGPGKYKLDVETLANRVSKMSCKSVGWKKTSSVTLPIMYLKNRNIYLQKNKTPMMFYNLPSTMNIAPKDCSKIKNSKNRFDYTIKNDFPGPGTYGNPFEKAQKKCYNSKIGLIPTAIISSPDELNFTPGPGAYDIPIPKIRSFAFSSREDRNKLLIKINSNKLGPGSYEPKEAGCMEASKIKGKFYKAKRFLKKPVLRHMLVKSFKSPNEPGPGYYNPRWPEKCFKKAIKGRRDLCRRDKVEMKLGFLSTVDRLVIMHKILLGDPELALIAPNAYQPTVIEAFLPKDKKKNLKIDTKINPLAIVYSKIVQIRPGFNSSSYKFPESLKKVYQDRLKESSIKLPECSFELE